MRLAVVARALQHEIAARPIEPIEDLQALEPLDALQRLDPGCKNLDPADRPVMAPLAGATEP
ncbi:hypothetical protein D3C87_1805480 [compost metagenome]